MLATFVIGLREGLEAVLVVSIVAAFLKRNGISRRPMWLGVAAAVAICIGVGFGLQAFEQALPQAQQEGLEAVIGLVAVVFVTLMIAWMGTHARGLKADLEGAATAAVNSGTAWALAAMAFLAVVKEGFETAVFLLATLQASTTVWAAAVGAVAGIAVSCAVGYLLYRGGIRLDLRRFFRISSVFLVFVAAGLLLTAVRRAHGAGWIDIGQQRTIDLSWLAPIGSVRSALITGVLGIPADPRAIEAVAWLLFLVPMLLVALWPPRWRPRRERKPLLKLSIAAALALTAVAMTTTVPVGSAPVPATLALAPLSGGRAEVVGANPPTLRILDASGTTQSLAFRTGAHTATVRAGAAVDEWTAQAAVRLAGRPSELTIDELSALFGRVPVGISALQNPGPYRAAWSEVSTTRLWTAGGGLVDARRVDRTTVVLTGGGLTGPRTLTFDRTAWSAPETAVAERVSAVAAGQVAARESSLWRIWLPLVLGAAAALLALSAWRDTRARRAVGSEPPQSSPPTDSGAPAAESSRRSTSYAAP